MFRNVLFTAIFTLGSLSLPLAADDEHGVGDHGPAHHKLTLRASPLEGPGSELGVSGSSLNFVEMKGRLYCYAGTLGALVEDEGGTYILSNNHVLARENDGEFEEPMIQAGILDQGPGCSINYSDRNDIVAHLKYFVPLQLGKSLAKAQDNTVDAAIAKINVGANLVRADGAIMDIGTLSPYIETEAGGIDVQKSGRTTGHTYGYVFATNATINVQYGTGYGRFYDQIHIKPPDVENPPVFSAGGDSGSLIVTVPSGTGKPQAVGLLFAGGDTATYANPIKLVLEEMGTDMVGCTELMGQESPPSESCAVGTVAPVTVAPDPAGDEPNGGGRPDRTKKKSDNIPAGHERAYEVMQRNSDRLFAIEGVLGHGLSRDSMGRPEIVVYLRDNRRAVGQGVPMRLEEFNVRTIVTGPIKAY